MNSHVVLLYLNERLRVFILRDGLCGGDGVAKTEEPTKLFDWRLKPQLQERNPPSQIAETLDAFSLRRQTLCLWARWRSLSAGLIHSLATAIYSCSKTSAILSMSKHLTKGGYKSLLTLDEITAKYAASADHIYIERN